MYKYVNLLLLLLTATCCLAQPSISGIVEDSSHNALPYCKVTLTTSPGGKIIKGTIADDKGHFSIEPLVAGQYVVGVKYTGFADYNSRVLTIDTTSREDMGIILMQPAPNALTGVSITAQRPVIEFKNGTIILNVESDLLANGNTVLELLRRLPGVMVDAQNNVTVDGSSGIGFLIDGRLQQIPAAQVVTILNSMPAESVASIELIRNPPAQYDAAGTSGLINIVSKKVRLRGFSGNVLENAGYGRRGSSMSALSLNYKTNKLTLMTNTSYTNKDVLTGNYMARTLSEPQGITTINAIGRSESFVSALNFKGGLEYEPAKHTTLGINITHALARSDEFTVQNTNIEGGAASDYNYMINNAGNPEKYNSPSVGIYAAHTFDTMGTKLVASVDLTHFTDRYSGLNRNSFFYNEIEAAPMLAYDNHKDLDFRIWTPKLDLTKMLTRTLTLHAGGKTSFTENSNNSSLERNIPGTETYYPDTVFSNLYDYKEQILAAYADVAKTLSKGSVQLGLRGEQTNIDAINHVNGYTFRQHYFNLFPSLSIDHRIDKKNSVQLSYSYRIYRPAYNQLNPIRVFSDALDYSAGNPELKPQYSHKIIAGLNLGQALNFSLVYNHTDNAIYNMSYTLPGTQTNADTTFNFASSDHLVLRAFAQYQAAKWYSMQAVANFMYGNRRGIVDSIYTTIKTLAVQASINNSISLPVDMRLQVNARYTSPYKDGVQQYHQRGSADVAIQKKLLKGKLNATLGIYDLFYTDRNRWTSMLPGQYYDAGQQPDTRRVGLTLNYRFGNMKIDRKINDEDADNSRIKKGN